MAVLAVVLVVAGYVCGGISYAWWVARTTPTRPRLRLHPHYARWVEAVGLCMDGIRFARQQVIGGGGSGSGGGGAAGRLTRPKHSHLAKQQHRTVTAASGEARKSKGSRSKGSRSTNDHKRKKSKDSQREQLLPRDSNEDDGIGSAPRAEGNTAAGGGRWVRVPT
jgi:hypothetical protein